MRCMEIAYSVHVHVWISEIKMFWIWLKSTLNQHAEVVIQLKMAGSNTQHSMALNGMMLCANAMEKERKRNNYFENMNSIVHWAIVSMVIDVRAKSKRERIK